MQPTFFTTPAELRVWFEEHHQTGAELLVGFHKKGSGRPSITWRQAVDQALCFGWIDSIGRSLGDDSYSVRFTPRRPGSNWSKLNVERAGELIEAGLMAPAGLRAFEARTAGTSGANREPLTRRKA
jgi:uncharacterized protein YdeI (YjbR/CyaY-like superfamily)